MTVTRLELRERVALDRAPIDEMCRALGPERAEGIVGGAMEELAVWLSRADKLRAAGQWGDLVRLARSTEAMAARLGMWQLARIAGEAAALSGDPGNAALAAVTARMVRVGEGSLVAVWDLQNLSV